MPIREPSFADVPHTTKKALSMTKNKPVTLGVIVGTRGFFPDHLCKEGREVTLNVLRKLGFKTVVVEASLGKKFGAIESVAEARACAELFRKNADKIDGILVTLPNFGDERAVANAIRWSGLSVPVLVHAWPDDPARMDIANRRDSFCGKMSCCSNLRQYGIPYSLTTLHCVRPESDSYRNDLLRFAQICRVVRGMKNLRVGVIGARPAPFTTVRYSEKLLEAAGISVETLDLSELIHSARKLKQADYKEKLASIKEYTPCGKTPAAALERMARMGVAIDRWMADNELRASTIQCWTALENIEGIVPCCLMSMMSEGLLPSACECDVAGLVGMYALQLATNTPSALLDWNNNYAADPDKGVLFHCSNLPKSFFADHRMDYQAIIAGTVGKQNACGTVVGRVKASPFTFLRIGTDDVNGVVRGYVGKGRFTDDPLDTFGGYGVFEVQNLQTLLQFICRNGFEHHTAATLAFCADAVREALGDYLGWDIYQHV